MTWIVDVLLALLYPPSCVACDRDLLRAGPPRFCGACRASLGNVVDPCRHCAEPAAAPICDRCALDLPPFRRTLACSPYRDDSTLAAAIVRWKYDGAPEVGVALEREFAERTASAGLCYDLVVPVPLHRSKLRSRGFNQAALLARALTRLAPTTGRFAPDVLIRTSAASVQARLGRGARSRNARAAFRARRPVPGRTILLVDDVFTSGATAASCASALRDAGASLVDVAVLARTPRSGARP
ncbi:MAG: phosphoribosyltransferase family protein [Candidatus Binatia bacterium]|nr:phosphoribosyltransferase family protein [Candidatus Binatia bacterium]